MVTFTKATFESKFDCKTEELKHFPTDTLVKLRLATIQTRIPLNKGQGQDEETPTHNTHSPWEKFSPS